MERLLILLFVLLLSCITLSCTSFTWVYSWGGTKKTAQFNSNIKLSTNDVLPFVLYDGYVLINADIDGLGPGAFVWDLGGWGNLFNQKYLVPSLEKEEHPTITLIFENKPVQLSKPICIRNVRFGPHIVNDFWFEPIDFSVFDISSKTKDARSIYGIIGVNNFYKNPFIISFSRCEILGLNPQYVSVFNGNNIFPSEGNQRKLAHRVPIRAQIENDSLTMFLDTGAGYSCLQYKKAKSLAESNPSQWVREERVHGKTRYWGKVKSVTIDNYTVEDVFFHSNPYGFEEGTLGTDVIKYFDWLIDLPGKNIQATPWNSKKITIQQSDITTIGFEVKQKGKIAEIVGLFYIGDTQVCPGIKMGQKIVLINGVSPDEYDWSNWKSPGTFEFEIEDGKETFTITRVRTSFEDLIKMANE